MVSIFNANSILPILKPTFGFCAKIGMNQKSVAPKKNLTFSIKKNWKWIFFQIFESKTFEELIFFFHLLRKDGSLVPHPWTLPNEMDERKGISSKLKILEGAQMFHFHIFWSSSKIARLFCFFFSIFPGPRHYDPRPGFSLFGTALNYHRFCDYIHSHRYCVLKPPKTINFEVIVNIH